MQHGETVIGEVMKGWQIEFSFGRSLNGRDRVTWNFKTFGRLAGLFGGKRRPRREGAGPFPPRAALPPGSSAQFFVPVSCML